MYIVTIDVIFNFFAKKFTFKDSDILHKRVIIYILVGRNPVRSDRLDRRHSIHRGDFASVPTAIVGTKPVVVAAATGLRALL